MSALTEISRPAFPRRGLTPRVRWLLIGMRIYVLLAIPIVIYAFVKALLT